MPGKNVTISMNLARLLVAEPEDLKNPQEYEDVQKVAKALLRLLMKI